ncbi:hypothetical protein MMAD_18060 [Mycolicibacterium madagascariense]|uniref:Uncharacterized protein n=1 Tax=Mycolicibacterium madagascariense TaxID=212765 RepID=A0A7I7XEI1_9MYCO|nr:hypothetical protein [Mycolicibacterium madagascariense]MCV7015218.1 hypothetical protein [Mycolicibacterium madagascariense]BBZ27511.1 hypothetical protein MMAD_18060 [Mycolicibacterium madagascariense]
MHEIAWRLSDYGVPDTLKPAPDVSEAALQQKANRLALLGVITHAKGTLYLIPPKPAAAPAPDEPKA